MDNNHACLDAAGHLLSVPFHYLPLRDLEEQLQEQTSLFKHGVINGIKMYLLSMKRHGLKQHCVGRTNNVYF